MTTKSSIVLLLRDQSSAPDPYESVFVSSKFQPYTLPVLETAFANTEKLLRVVASGPIQREYDGVIITSKRACEAWIHAVQDIISSLKKSATRLAEARVVLDDPEPQSLLSWLTVPFYVVGKGTASAIREVEALFSDVFPLLSSITASNMSRSLDIRGDGCGSGEQLAHLILDDVKSRAHHKDLKLLYLTGDKNRDTIPRILASENPSIKLDPLQVYATQGAASFGPKLDELMHKVQNEGTIKTGRDWWIVYFAPSSASFADPFLRKHFDLNPRSDSQPTSITKAVPRIAAIGRTTASFVTDELGTQVDAIAHKPTPQDLMTAINEASRY